MDLIASELGMDPVDVRRKNLIPAGRLPVHDRVRHDVRHRRLRARARRSAEDRRRAEAPRGASGAAHSRRPPAARHRRHARTSRSPRSRRRSSARSGARRRHGDRADRRVAAGTGPRDGDGADRLGGPGRAVRDGACRPFGQRASCREGAGTWGSRSLQVGGSAVSSRHRRWSRRRAPLASHLLEVDEADLTEPRGGALRGGGRAGTRRSRGRSSRRPRTTRRGFRRA